MQRGFVRPNWYMPLDVAQRLAAVPKDRTVKGMFFSAALRQAGIRDEDLPPSNRYAAFKDYPIHDLIVVLADCAPKAHPNVSGREAIRRMGHHAYRHLMNSTIARVIFSVAGRELNRAVQLVSKVYDTIANGGSATVVRNVPGEAMIELRGLWVFPDVYHLGVYEEAIRDYGHCGEVLLRKHSVCDVDLLLKWSNK